MKLKALLLLLCCSGFAAANDFKPVMIYDGEVILDNAWNESVHTGIKKFEQKFGIPVKEARIFNNKLTPNAKTLIEAVLAHAKAGFNPIMINDFDNETMRKIVRLEPKLRFIVFNGSYNVPNAHFFMFSYQEAAFLAGYLAAKKSSSKKLGFIGGRDISGIRNTLCGYIKGARHAYARIKVEFNFISDALDGWNSPELAYDMAIRQIENGADVLYPAAGASSQGALRAADEKGVYSIGSDSNQNALYPGSVLTSVLVNVGDAVYRALVAAHRNIWREQLKILGLQENGVGLAFDRHNAPLISGQLKSEIDQLRADIILKKIDLPNYVITQQCTDQHGIIF
ncbi:BMP family ABC transporter substrate-binding protein [Thalassomonas viridans]|uniref:BMP family ABC transporter substrate-binding protein n=1 Tax=Thalassomonas viridans TaxID=137584 RepID=A0AAF0CD48_9GAMM|nr:BMP family ABC transporter substrate-binding protein [Thalassomonas viridans]WDE08506.1 BMP family ABC transporter substrate-binding protein [Thalassomonas viridans]